MNNIGNTNMHKTYFEHQKLASIQGKPNFNNLHGMALQLKASASSLPSTLGGAMHVYIGMIFLLKIYTTLVLMDPFITPVHMTALNVVHDATQYDITFAKLQHKERIRAGINNNGMPNAVLKQTMLKFTSMVLSEKYFLLTYTPS